MRPQVIIDVSELSQSLNEPIPVVLDKKPLTIMDDGINEGKGFIDLILAFLAAFIKKT